MKSEDSDVETDSVVDMIRRRWMFWMKIRSDSMGYDVGSSFNSPNVDKQDNVKASIEE